MCVTKKTLELLAFAVTELCNLCGCACRQRDELALARLTALRNQIEAGASSQLATSSAAWFHEPLPKRGHTCSMRGLNHSNTHCKREPARTLGQRMRAQS